MLTANISELQQQEEADDAVARDSGGGQGAAPALSRKRSSMSELSGGKGVTYAEGARGTTKTKVTNALFQKRKAEKKARTKAQRDAAGE